jgi:hypothetical protein
MFSKSKAMAEELLSIAKQRVAELRCRSFSDLASLPEASEEEFAFRGKPASLCTYRVHLPDGNVRVFVTTSKRHLAGMVYTVNGDGFVVAPDGTLSDVTDEMRWEYL